MLVLSRKKDERIMIGDRITITVVEVRGDKVRLGFEAPRDISIHREEIFKAIQRDALIKNSEAIELESDRDVNLTSS